MSSFPVTLRRAAAVVGVLALGAVGTACGGDDSNGSSPQGLVAQQFIDEISEDGIDIDESCVRSATSKLSDSDARAILADDDDNISPQAMQVAFELLECIDFDFSGMIDDLDDLEELLND